jgi:hypothetical protein
MVQANHQPELFPRQEACVQVCLVVPAKSAASLHLQPDSRQPPVPDSRLRVLLHE